MDLAGHTIVIFSLFRFDAEIESTSYALARELAEKNRVFYFDNPYTVNDLLKKRKTQALKKRRGLFKIRSDKSIHPDVPNLEVFISPVLLSINFLPEGKLYRTLLGINESRITRKILHVLKKRKVEKFIFINSFNFHYPHLLRKASPRLRVYHCLDPIIGEFNERHGVISEAIVLRQSDLVICSSRQLFLEKSKTHPNTHFIPNAADLEHSQRATDPDLALSPLLAGVPQPIVGYLGSIDHRMDFNFLAVAAKANPDKSFVLIGPRFAELPREIVAAPNVYFPGKVGYDEVPAVLKGFSICMIPFKKDEHSAAVFPLKLFEYLGTAKPVVISDFNSDLQDFTLDSVVTCDNPTSFARAIQVALLEDSADQRARRIQIASMNTWKRRGEDMRQLMAENLAQGDEIPLERLKQ